MKQWLEMNERNQALPGDPWYVDFARKLFPIISNSKAFGRSNLNEQISVTLTVCLYFQDAVAQSGGWKLFADSYRSCYGTPLPFYQLTDTYVPDEVNLEDIAFVLWTFNSHTVIFDESEFTIADPFDKAVMDLSQQLYEQMDAAFEEAPINEEPSTPVWVMGIDQLEIPARPEPEIKPGMKLKPDVERCLAYSAGKPLSFFATYSELRSFFVNVLKWENKSSALLPELAACSDFVVYANAKGLMVAPDVAPYFKEPHNPLYDARLAAKEGYKLFCLPGFCPLDLLKYGMSHGVLLDVQLPFPNGKELLHANWDFLARYYLNEFYENEFGFE